MNWYNGKHVKEMEMGQEWLKHGVKLSDVGSGVREALRKRSSSPLKSEEDLLRHAAKGTAVETLN